jgi:hypothetical protein
MLREYTQCARWQQFNCYSVVVAVHTLLPQRLESPARPVAVWCVQALHQYLLLVHWHVACYSVQLRLQAPDWQLLSLTRPDTGAAGGCAANLDTTEIWPSHEYHLYYSPCMAGLVVAFALRRVCQGEFHVLLLQLTPESGLHIRTIKE